MFKNVGVPVPTQMLPHARCKMSAGFTDVTGFTLLYKKICGQHANRDREAQNLNLNSELHSVPSIRTIRSPISTYSFANYIKIVLKMKLNGSEVGFLATLERRKLASGVLF